MYLLIYDTMHFIKNRKILSIKMYLYSVLETVAEASSQKHLSMLSLVAYMLRVQELKPQEESTLMLKSF